MIALNHTGDYIVMLLIAAGIGAIGGLGAELLIKRSESTGTIELPHRLKESQLVALGLPASLIVGAIAAVAALYFFSPVTETVVPAASVATTSTVTHQYSLAKLVPLALIVGSAGPAFLASAQSRLVSALNAQRVDAVASTAKNQLTQVEESAKAAVPGAVRKALAEEIPDATADTQQAVADKATEELDQALKPQVSVAQSQIDTVASHGHPRSAPRDETDV
jgi:hypothetical protein